VKLYTKEEGSFAQLPLYVRALAAMLLKLADETGRISLRGKDPCAAVAFQLGADQGDRRLLRKHIPALIADGYLVLEGGDLFVRNFTVAQTGVDRVKLDSCTSETRVEHESDARIELSGQSVVSAVSAPTRAEHEPFTRSELTKQNQTGSFRRSDLRREEEREKSAVRSGVRSDPAVRRDLAKRAVSRLNDLRRELGDRFQLGNVLPLTAAVQDEIQLRLAETGDDDLGAKQLDLALECLAAEAAEERSVARLSKKSFEPARWLALTTATPLDARRTARARIEIADRAARESRRAPAPLAFAPSSREDFFPARAEEEVA
jgi:hypothetical protein